MNELLANIHAGLLASALPATPNRLPVAPGGFGMMPYPAGARPQYMLPAGASPQIRARQGLDPEPLLLPEGLGRLGLLGSFQTQLATAPPRFGLLGYGGSQGYQALPPYSAGLLSPR